MTDDLRAKLASEIDETTWTPLEPHARREALFLVDHHLPLLDAALAIATNRTAIVAHWLGEGVLRRPDAATKARYDETPESTRFRFVVVQPFVLASPLSNDPEIP